MHASVIRHDPAMQRHDCHESPANIAPLTVPGSPDKCPLGSLKLFWCCVRNACHSEIVHMIWEGGWECSELIVRGI